MLCVLPLVPYPIRSLTCFADVGGEHHEQQGCGRIDVEPHHNSFDGSVAAQEATSALYGVWARRPHPYLLPTLPSVSPVEEPPPFSIIPPNGQTEPQGALLFL